MSKLDKLLRELCPDGVKYKKLVDAVSIERGKRVVRSQLSIRGKYPVYQNSLTPLGYHTDYNYNANTTFIIVAGAAGEIGFSDKAFWAADDCFTVVCPENVLNRYIYHLLLNNQNQLASKVRKASIPRLSRSAIENLVIPIPPLDVQREIVRMLDSYTESVVELQRQLTVELTARGIQYSYYRNKLLTFHSDTKIVQLADIADIGTGSSNTNEAVEDGKYPFFVRSQEPLRKNDFEYDETAIITAGDGVGVGKVYHYIEGRYALHQRAYRIHINTPEVVPKYYFHYMKAKFLPYIQKTMFQGSVASIRRPMLNAFPVPVPSLDVQNRIVNVLDNFEKICSDLNIGLPAEIEARQKQYEYYRDKLLTFAETGNTILNGTERNGTERNGTERNGTERNAD